MTFLPLMIERLAQQAPGIRIDVVPMNVSEVDGLLKQRRIDFAVGKISSTDPGIHGSDVFNETYSAIFRRGHPRIGKVLTPEIFLSCSHAVVTDAAGHWQVTSLQMDAGMGRADIQVNLPHFTALPFVVSASDLIAVVPSSTAAAFAARWALDHLPLPFALPGFTVRLLWNAGKTLRADERSWMVDTIRAALANLALASGQMVP